MAPNSVEKGFGSPCGSPRRSKATGQHHPGGALLLPSTRSEKLRFCSSGWSDPVGLGKRVGSVQERETAAKHGRRAETLMQESWGAQGEAPTAGSWGFTLLGSRTCFRGWGGTCTGRVGGLAGSASSFPVPVTSTPKGEHRGTPSVMQRLPQSPSEVL